MKIINIQTLAIPNIKVISFQRFTDERGYFTETMNIEQLKLNDELSFLHKYDFLQFNEAHSKANTLRGLHFQWSPNMGKLVRCIEGRLIDFALDIRIGSPYFGKIVGFDLNSKKQNNHSEWIWIPPGFAHGTLLAEESTIEYLCTSTWSPNTEFGISPLANDIDWSFCDEESKKIFFDITNSDFNINSRDLNYPNLREWINDERSKNFIYQAEQS